MGKKKKHIFSLIVIFLMILSMFPTSAFAEIDGYTGDSGQPAADSGSYIADDVQGSAEDNNTGSQDVITADDSTGTDNQTTPDADSNDTDKQDLINPAGNFGENNNVGGPGDNDRGRGDNDKDWGGDKDKDKDNSYYNHIDVRVDASLTLVSKVNGVVIKSEKVAVKTSNVSATLNGSPVTFYKKSGTGKENEWRADGLSLNPNSSTETVTVTCNLSGTKTDGSSVNVTVTKTYTGSSALWQLVNNCPGRNGYDIDIVAEDISESFTVDKTVTKVWADNNNNDSTRPSSIQIQLYADGVAYGSPVTLNALNSWTAKFTDLPKYSTGTTEVVYTADEVTVPTGYTKSISADGMTITNTYTQQKTSVSVTKAWNDNDNNDGIRPDNVKVQLYADGTAVSGKTLTLSADNSWKGTFTDLPVYKNGKAITYTVKENAVKGYTSAVTGTAKDGFTITNTHTPETINICGSKTWADSCNNDGVRPESITVNLMNGDEVVASKTVTANDNWAWKFENVQKYKDGKEISYSIKEEAVKGYTTSYNGYNVKNTHEIEKTSISVTKAWNDSGNNDGIRAAEVTVQLYADGAAVSGKTLTLSKDNGWTASFTDLPVYKDGKEIVYTVKEDAVKGYTSEVTGTAKDGFTITNTHTPETITVSGAKTWADEDNNDGVRPESITVKLMNGNDVVASKTVTANDNWAWSFTGINKYKDGKEISYSIREEAVEAYTTSYDGYNVKNTHEIEKTSISVTKEWNDDGNNDGIRPETVTVQLYADGTAVEGKTLTLSEANQWTAIFEDLPVYNDGKVIEYTVEENAVDGYTATVDKTTDGGFVVTNTHESETMDISVVKEWKDGDNKDKIRPESIMVQLCVNGDPIDDQILILSDLNNWSGAFKDLPVYKEGQEISYTITENEVDGYTAEISGSAKDGFVITNSHTPGEDPTPVPPTDNTDKTVKTGDTTNVLLWAVLLAAAVLCFCGTLCFRRRNTQR
jgi:hypothetical protein